MITKMPDDLQPGDRLASESMLGLAGHPVTVIRVHAATVDWQGYPVPCYVIEHSGGQSIADPRTPIVLEVR